MHELGLCEPLVDGVLRRAGGRTVTAVRVRVGDRHAVAEDAFRQAFEVAAQGTVAGHADVELVVTPGDELVLESIWVREEETADVPGDTG